MMTCREVERLLDLFLDGELEARTMRAVALHVTRCPQQCEATLQRLERVEDLLAETFAEAVADVDFSRFWPTVAEHAGALGPPWYRAPLERIRARGARPLLAVAAAVLVGAALWRATIPAVAESARANNQVRIDSLTSEAPSVALLSEPVTNTTVIWVADEAGAP